MILVVAGVVAGVGLVAWAASRPAVVPPPPPAPPQNTPTPDTSKAQPNTQQPTPNLANVNTGSGGGGVQQQGGGVSAGGSFLQLGAALGKFIAGGVATQESTRAVVPYIAAGVTLVVSAVFIGVLGAGAMLGPWGVVAAVVVMIAVVLITGVVDSIVVAVKKGDWSNLSAELRDLRNVKLDAKSAQEVFVRAVVEMQLGEDVRSAKTNSGAVAYFGAPFMPSPLTWSELALNESQFPPNCKLMVDGGEVWQPLTGPVEDGKPAPWVTAARADAERVRSIGLNPVAFGAHPDATGAPGLVVDGGKLVFRTSGERDIRGATFPLWWFDADYATQLQRSGVGEKEYDIRARVVEQLAAAIGGTGPGGLVELVRWQGATGADGGAHGQVWQESTNAYVGAVFAGLCPWLSDRAVLWYIGRAAMPPERPASITRRVKKSRTVATAADLADHFGPLRFATESVRGWSLSYRELREWQRTGRLDSIADPYVRADILDSIQRGEDQHVELPPNFWPLKLTAAEAAVDAFMSSPGAPLLPPPPPPAQKEPPPPGSYAAHVEAGDAKTAQGSYVVLNSDGTVSASPETLKAQQMAASREAVRAAVNDSIEQTTANTKGGFSVSANDSTGATVGVVPRKG